MFSYLTILRPVNCLMAAVAVYIASLIAGVPASSLFLVLIAMATTFLVCAGGMVINDYFDVEIDKINKPNRPIPSGKIKRNIALIYSIVLFAVGAGISYLVNFYALAVALAATTALILYAWKLKKILLVGNLTISALVGMTFIYGGLVNMNWIPVASLAFLAFLANTGREIFKSIDDVMGDKKNNVRSLPVKYGVVKARVVASAFILAAVFLSFAPYILGFFGNIYLFFIIITDLIFMAAIAIKKASAKMCKYAMLVALVSFLAGALYAGF